MKITLLLQYGSYSVLCIIKIPLLEASSLTHPSPLFRFHLKRRGGGGTLVPIAESSIHRHMITLGYTSFISAVKYDIILMYFWYNDRDEIGSGNIDGLCRSFRSNLSPNGTRGKFFVVSVPLLRLHQLDSRLNTHPGQTPRMSVKCGI